MKYLFKILIILTVLTTTSNSLFAQIDTNFWFAAPWVTPDHDDRDPIAFHFSTFNNPTTVRIQQPASTYDTTFTVPANSLFSKFVDFMMDSLESKPANQVLRTGFHITSNYPMIVVYDVVTRGPASNNPETYSLKGTNGIGYEFVLPFQTLWNNKTLGSDYNGDGVITQPYSQFNIVATEDNTTIYITPRCPIIGHPANVTFPVFLPFKGNVYTGQNVTQLASIPGNNLSGTIVVSDKPISVTVSDDSVNPSAGGGCYDLMGDQIVPTDVIGTEYIVNKGFLNPLSNESIFIVATQNFTSILVDGGNGVTNAIINQGETFQYSITDSLTFVQGDKPIYVYHMSGVGCELGEAILPPNNCSGSDQVSFSRETSRNFYLNILCRSGDEGNFTLNGNTTIINSALFKIVPGTASQWVGAQILFDTLQIPVASSNLLTNSTGLFSLGIFNGSATGGVMYHYLSSFNRKVYVSAGEDTTLCDGYPTIDLNGSVAGGSNTGIWTVLNGTGTINNPTNLITTYQPTTSDYSQGTLTFVLASTGNCEPVLDTIKINFIQSAKVTATSDSSLCKNNAALINLAGTLNFAAGATWSGGNGGSFDNASNLNTTYIPSPADLTGDSLVLFLTSLGSVNSCPNDQDTLVIYFTPSPVVNPGSNLVVCSSTDSIVLNGSVSGPTSTGIWTTTGSGGFSPSELVLNSSYYISSADTASGSIWFTLTTTNNGNCLAEKDSIQVTILDKPQVTINTSDSICSNSSNINLNGNVTLGFTSTWTTNGAGNIVTPTALNTVYSISPIDVANGYIDFVLATNPLICTPEQDSIRVYFVNPPTVDAGINQAFCDNEIIGLNGSISGPNQSGNWITTGTGSFSPSSGLLNTFYYPSALDVSSGGVNLILSSSGAFGCVPDNDTLFVTFKPAPNADFNSVPACQNDITLLNDASTTTSGSINSWFWDFGDFTTSTTQNPLHSYNSNGSITVELIVGSTNGCFDTIQKNITVYPLPIADFTNTIPCESNPIEFLDNSFISSGSIVNWMYYFTPTESINSPNATYTYQTPGNYNITYAVTSSLGCTDSIIKTINVLVGPDANFSINPNPALALETVFFNDLSNGNNITNWYWNFGDETGNNNQNTTNSYSDGGEYLVFLTVTDINNCTDTASKELLIALPPVLPTAFSPNGDGENDVFIIRGGPFNSVIFNIYNNWGELLFQSNDRMIGWDGTFKGNESPLGVYTWTFEIEIIGGKVIKKSGDVTLIR